MTLTLSRKSLDLKVGDRVRVRPRHEILATLDEHARLDGLPFMPQMLDYCGKEFRVYRRAHKTCDTVNKTGGRSMVDAVHLNTPRCDGRSHGGCEMGCLLFWKDAWLEPADDSPEPDSVDRIEAARESGPAPICSPATLERETISEETRGQSDPCYVCQTTELPRATEALHWWDPRQYWKDFRSGNAGLRRLLDVFSFSVFNHVLKLDKGVRLLIGGYNAVQRATGGVPYPHKMGLVPKGTRTPTEVLDLQPGELVRVKSHDEIVATLDERNKNRGLFFDVEEVPYCGKIFRVRNRVTKIIDEESGRMIQLPTPSVILEGAFCQSSFSEKRLLCPRSIYAMWREAWLERVDPKEPGVTPEPVGDGG